MILRKPASKGLPASRIQATHNLLPTSASDLRSSIEHTEQGHLVDFTPVAEALHAVRASRSWYVGKAKRASVPRPQIHVSVRA